MYYTKNWLLRGVWLHLVDDDEVVVVGRAVFRVFLSVDGHVGADLILRADFPPPRAHLRGFRVVRHAVADDGDEASAGGEHLQRLLDVLAANADCVLSVRALGVGERRIHHDDGRTPDFALADERVEHRPEVFRVEVVDLRGDAELFEGLGASVRVEFVEDEFRAREV